MIRVGDHWLADFASCNYLGFDLDREIIDAVPAYLDAWGTHPSWSRLLGSPVLYEQIEERLTELLGCEDSLVLPTITHIHMSVIPLLAASGTIFLDARAHKTIYDGCQVARVARRRGARASASRTPTTSTSCCAPSATRTRLVCMDGVNSMTGNAPDLRAFAAVARAHGALLYVDDAHGFGVIGERAPDETVALRHARQQRRAPRRRDLRQPRARRRLLEGLLVAAGVHRLPDRGQAAAEGRRAAVPVLRARRRSPRWPRCSPASTSTSAAATRCARELHAPHRARARRRCDRARRRHAEPLGLPDHRDPAARPRAHRRRRALPVRPRRLRHARRLPARAQGRGRLPRPADRGQHRRRGRHADRGARGARRRAASCAARRGRRSRRHDATALRVGRAPRGPPTSPSARSCCALYLSRPAVQGQRPGDEPARPLAGDRDPRRRPPCTGPRRALPWLLLRRSASALFWLGDLYTYSYPQLLGADVPFPSLGDALYLAVYPALMAGLLLLVRRRNAGTRPQRR